MNKHWFHKQDGLWSKEHGWGWWPISWEGWVFIVLFVALLVGAAFLTGILGESPTILQGFIFLGAAIVLFALAVIVGYQKTR